MMERCKEFYHYIHRIIRTIFVPQKFNTYLFLFLFRPGTEMVSG